MSEAISHVLDLCNSHLPLLPEAWLTCSPAPGSHIRPVLAAGSSLALLLRDSSVAVIKVSVSMEVHMGALRKMETGWKGTLGEMEWKMVEED